ncbi:MAG: GNAT family N-acetyltransferase [Beijerinckiaceae bacterium]
MSETKYTIRFQPSLTKIAAEDWDACAVGASGHAKPNPFVSHAFLLALEKSGCTGARTGWNPAHVLVETAAGELVAAAPCYLKTHSQGEYVFDHGWADAFERAGGQYYPKVQVSAPFSPVPGPRLLVKAGEHAEEARKALVQGLRALRDQTDSSSIHITFTTQEDWEALGADGFLQRIDQQFHWQNSGYASFDAFLENLSSRKRKMIRRERRDALANGITIEWLTGKNLQEKHWDAFFAFYEDTGARKWGRPYLNRAFFSEISEAMGEQILLIMAVRDGGYIAGALNLIGNDALYGRNWGCSEDHPFLHFEVCYYQAIDFAIQNKMLRVEAGAQGEHKLARGYMPSTTYSAHDIANKSLRRAVADYLDREKEHVAMVQTALAAEGPFRKIGQDDSAKL